MSLHILGPAAAAAVTAMVYSAPLADAAATAYKVQRPANFSEGFRLDAACDGCFPGKMQSCPSEDVWGKCCEQEVACHDFHCKELVMGELSANTAVRVLENFESDDDQKVTLEKGMKGKVLRIDGQGDAYIKFHRDELDDEGLRHWVYKTTFWSKLELPGKADRLRALRIVDCLDACSLAAQCKFADPTAPKKEKKAYGKCVTDCNIEKCRQEKDCEARFQAYAMCKSQTSASGKCSPLTQASEEEASAEDDGDDDAKVEL